MYHSPWLAAHNVDPAIRLAAATCASVLAEHVPVALVIALAEERRFCAMWRECYFWSLPYYLGGAAVAQVASSGEQRSSGGRPCCSPARWSI